MSSLRHSVNLVKRAADRVVVPNVVGMPFHVGRDLAYDAGVTLANPDPDEPPIGALAWPGLIYITSQRPTAGTELYRWDSVVIEVAAYGEADSTTRAPFPDKPRVDSAQAHPRNDSYVDAAGAEDRASSATNPLGT